MMTSVALPFASVTNSNPVAVIPRHELRRGSRLQRQRGFADPLRDHQAATAHRDQLRGGWLATRRGQRFPNVTASTASGLKA
jgi:hypothetical protein